MACTRESGTCATCQSYCRHKPGWFLPGEAEKAAALLRLTLQELFDKHLAVDWWWNLEGPDTFILSPAITTSPAGQEFPTEPRGTCVFFQEGRCQIHAAKPFECRDALCTSKESDAHSQAAQAWDKPEHQAQIRELLGREPQAEEYGIDDAIDAVSRILGI